MADLIPPQIWAGLRAFVDEIKAGRWNGGGQVLLNISPEGEVTSMEAKGRLENRGTLAENRGNPSRQLDAPLALGGRDGERLS